MKGLSQIDVLSRSGLSNLMATVTICYILVGISNLIDIIEAGYIVVVEIVV